MMYRKKGRERYWKIPLNFVHVYGSLQIKRFLMMPSLHAWFTSSGNEIDPKKVLLQGNKLERSILLAYVLTAVII